MLRRHLALPLAAVLTLLALPSIAATDQETVAAKVEEFRKAQVVADAAALNELSLPELSYSHSDGRVEDRAQFLANATSGKAPFVFVEYREPSVSVVGSTAIVRFHWTAEQQVVADGRKVGTNLKILMVWHKQGDGWKLLARSATKV